MSESGPGSETRSKDDFKVGDPHLQRADPGLADESLLLPQRGSVYQTIGEADRAILDFSDAIRLAPRETYPLINRGDACFIPQGQQRGRHRRPERRRSNSSRARCRPGPIAASSTSARARSTGPSPISAPASSACRRASSRSIPNRGPGRCSQPALAAAARAQPRLQSSPSSPIFSEGSRTTTRALRQGNRRLQRGDPDSIRSTPRPMSDAGRAYLNKEEMQEGDRRLQRGAEAVARPGVRPSAARHRLSPDGECRQGARGLSAATS